MPSRHENEGAAEVAYRVYEISPDDKVIGFTVITADSEEDAIAQTQALAYGHAVELWDRGRLIVRVSPNGN